jgi:hypothetical protein
VPLSASRNNTGDQKAAGFPDFGERTLPAFRLIGDYFCAELHLLVRPTRFALYGLEPLTIEQTRNYANIASISKSEAKERFPFFNWVAKTLSGRWALRSYLAIVFLLLLISTAARLSSYFMVRKIEAVLQGLSKIRLDQTTEEQMTKMVPYLTAKDWTAGGFSYRSYYVHISNESDGLPWPYALNHA